MARHTVDIETRFGTQAVIHLAGAYERVLLSLSGGADDRLPDRQVRQAIVDAMLTEGAGHGFDPDRLVLAGSAAVSDTSRRASIR